MTSYPIGTLTSYDTAESIAKKVLALITNNTSPQEAFNQFSISGIPRTLLHAVAREVDKSDAVMSAYGYPDGHLQVTLMHQR